MVIMHAALSYIPSSAKKKKNQMQSWEVYCCASIKILFLAKLIFNGRIICKGMNVRSANEGKYNVSILISCFMIMKVKY